MKNKVCVQLATIFCLAIFFSLFGMIDTIRTINSFTGDDKRTIVALIEFAISNSCYIIFIFSAIYLYEKAKHKK